ncbi:DMT family transporter [Clostridium gasigenes]|uniref:DMT family transporter n=1 Tax=Clostridium gasigenes TaxID=94869 RepID=A0A7X0SGB8_9CLOT|nr:DMT family transporter [Clostridium gasigenes]MBB6715046.1 DMT family transporter [Clostridium gasigenes]
MDREKFYTNRKNIMLLAILCCALWGSAYPSIKVGYSLFNIPSDDIATKLIFAGYRFLIAGIFVLIVQVVGKKKIFELSKKQALQVTILGLGQTTLQYIFFYIGLSYTTGVRGSIINGTSTFFSIIIAHFVYKNDKLNFNKILGCIIGFLGVIIVNFNGQSLLDSSFSFQGEGFIMIAAFLLSSTAIYGKGITQRIDPSIATGYQLTIGGAVLTILGFVLGGQLVGFTLTSSILLIYMALLSSVAFVIWAQLLKYNKVGIITIFNFSIPIFGTLLSAIILGENIFDIKILIALILVCIGIFLVYRVKDNK